MILGQLNLLTNLVWSEKSCSHYWSNVYDHFKSWLL